MPNFPLLLYMYGPGPLTRICPCPIATAEDCASVPAETSSVCMAYYYVSVRPKMNVCRLAGT